ncbi:MAG: tRNA (guanosine(46)-N7)-methyltransferase TrmB [Thermoguttaceae bacterium]|nr:tRNA (guanosine(46)-N7)-methyltransferase TrmB [Thermoguttaceae bacterium]MBQ9454403.1 tRNA (guanosine(46)-N7)-methyltransferase TrmB [Thermoguttaceae bacterium]
MPRRALRHIDESLDYSRHLFLIRELQQPWDLAKYFSDPAAPLEVEIGSGKGQFIHDAALAQPDHNFIGTEIAHKYAAYCAARLIKEGISNAVMFSGDGLQLFREFLPENSLAAVHVYFPDPWWKARHRKRRVVQMELVRACEKCLVPGGKLHFWTDVQEYFETALEMMAAESTLKGPFTPDVDPSQWRTHFEKRTVIEGRPVFRSWFEK